jgi:hypothetical protein
MRISLLETEQIEAHLLKRMETGDTLVFGARLLLDEELRGKTEWQQKTYHLIKLYGREQLKQEIAGAHQKLFSEEEHKTFRQKVLQLFRKP